MHATTKQQNDLNFVLAVKISGYAKKNYLIVDGRTEFPYCMLIFEKSINKQSTQFETAVIKV
jgi:hypothetical protein